MDEMTTDLQSDKLSASTVFHKTFIKFGSSVLLKRCVDLTCPCKSMFHCPFCDIHHFKGAKPCRVQDHLEESHWPTGVQYKDIFILRCFHLCGGERGGHYHCPVCPERVERRSKFVTHLQAHLESRKENVNLAYAPDAKQPPSLVSGNYTLRLCEAPCWNNPQPGLEHYHCPSCDNIQNTTASMANHLRRCHALARQRADTRVKSSSLEHPRTLFAQYWHKSIVRHRYDIPVRRCCSRRCCGRQYHCPLCTYEKTPPCTIANLRVHFSYHLDNAVNHRGYTFLACHLDCVQIGVASPSVHYHCGYCGLAQSDTEAFSRHLDTCSQGQATPTTATPTTATPTTDPGVTKLSPAPEESLQSLPEDIEESDPADSSTTFMCEPSFELPKSEAEIEMFESVTATLSQPFLKVFKEMESVSALLTEAAGVTSVEFVSAPGTDPTRPVLNMKGSLRNILRTESYLYEKFVEVNEDKSLKVKMTKSGGSLSEEEALDDFPTYSSPQIGQLSSHPNKASPFAKPLAISQSTLGKTGACEDLMPIFPKKASPFGEPLDIAGSLGHTDTSLNVPLSPAGEDHLYSVMSKSTGTMQEALRDQEDCSKTSSTLKTPVACTGQRKTAMAATGGSTTKPNLVEVGSSFLPAFISSQGEIQGRSGQVTSGTEDEFPCFQDGSTKMESPANATEETVAAEEASSFMEDRSSSMDKDDRPMAQGSVDMEVGSGASESGAFGMEDRTEKAGEEMITMKGGSSDGTAIKSKSLQTTQTRPTKSPCPPLKGVKRSSETPSEDISPKRYFTRGRKVDTSMLRKPRKLKRDQAGQKTATSPVVSKKVQLQDKPDATKGKVVKRDKVKEVVMTSHIKSAEPQNTKVFVLKQLPEDLKNVIATSSKTSFIGNQQIIHLNHIPDAVKQFLHPDVSVASSGEGKQAVPFSELPGNIQQALSPMVEKAMKSHSANASACTSEENKDVASRPQFLGRDSSARVKEVNTPRSLRSSRGKSETVSGCSSSLAGEIRRKAASSPKSSGISTPGSARRSEGNLVSNRIVQTSNTVIANGKVYSPVFKSTWVQVPQGNDTKQGTSSQARSNITTPPVKLSKSAITTEATSSDERSKVVLRQEPALQLPDLIQTQSCYLPSVHIGLSFSNGGLVVERTSSKQKAAEAAKGFEKKVTRPTTTPEACIQDKGFEEDPKPVSEKDAGIESGSNSAEIYPELEPSADSKPILNEIETLKTEKNVDAIVLDKINDMTVIVNKSLTCLICGQRFNKIEILSSHIMSSHLKYKCQGCFGVFINKEHLMQHLRNVHRTNCQPTGPDALPNSLSRDVFKCGHCRKSFGTRRLLDGHQRKVHQAEIRCTICQRAFSNVYRLSTHIILFHSKQGATVCDICGKGFSVERYMQSHRRRHFKEKKHSCPTCGKRFLDSNTLKDHEEIHKPAEHRRYRYICSYCGKRFNCRRSFLDHNNTHTGNRPHECKKCGKSFAFMTILKKHEKTKHDDRRPFKCDLCSKAFKLSAVLKAHMVTHTGVSEHTCPYCQRSFGTATICKSHMAKCKQLKVSTFDAGGNAQVIESMVASQVTDNMQVITEDSALAEVMQLAFGADQHTVEFQLTTDESDEVQQDSCMYMCSACGETFEDMATAEVHINQCQGSTPTNVVWENQEIETNSAWQSESLE